MSHGERGFDNRNVQWKSLDRPYISHRACKILVHSLTFATDWKRKDSFCINQSCLEIRRSFFWPLEGRPSAKWKLFAWMRRKKSVKIWTRLLSLSFLSLKCIILTWIALQQSKTIASSVETKSISTYRLSLRSGLLGHNFVNNLCN